MGAFWNSTIRPSVSWCSCLGYRHAGCLQLSHRRPPEMCGLRTRPRTDVDPPRLLPPSNCHRRGAYRLTACGGDTLHIDIIWCLFGSLAMNVSTWTPKLSSGRQKCCILLPRRLTTPPGVTRPIGVTTPPGETTPPGARINRKSAGCNSAQLSRRLRFRITQSTLRQCSSMTGERQYRSVRVQLPS